MNFTSRDNTYMKDVNNFKKLPHKVIIVGLDENNKKIIKGNQKNVNWTLKEANNKLSFYKNLINPKIKLMVNLKDSNYFCIDVDEKQIDGDTDYYNKLVDEFPVFDFAFYTKGTTKGYHFFFEKHKTLKNKYFKNIVKVNSKYQIDLISTDIIMDVNTEFLGGISDEYDINDLKKIFDEKLLYFSKKNQDKKLNVTSTSNSKNDLISKFLNNKLNFNYGGWTFNPGENVFNHNSLTCCTDCTINHSVEAHSCLFFNEGKYLVANCHSHPAKKIRISPIEAETLRKFCGIKTDEDILKENMLQERLKIYEDVKGPIKYFDEVAEKFEKENAKIISKSHYIQEKNNKIIIRCENQLKSSYSHLTYVEMIKNEPKEKTFISKWLNGNSKQRCYEDSDIYPKKELCPKNVYNLWKPFRAELFDEETVPHDHQLLLDHIKVLCDNEQTVYDVLIKWIAHMVQYPERKPGICPVLISKQGAGKGTFINMLRKMLGYTKVFETTTPDRDVWGQFNGLMISGFLVNLNELGKKEQLNAQGKIKALITDETLTVNQKGIQAFPIKSFHRLIVTTNKEEPVNVASDDRRFFVIRASDEKVGDKDYFNKLNSLLDNDGVILSLFNYFKNIKVKQNFTSEDIPKTQYHKELQVLSKPIITQFFEYYLEIHSDDEDRIVMVQPRDLYSNFKNWLKYSGLQYDCTELQFFSRVWRMKYKCITKKHTMKGNITIIDLDGEL